MAGSLSADPDSLGGFMRYHSKQIGGQNMARFRWPAVDALYERLQVMPDGPERRAVYAELKRLAVVYMPYKAHAHRIWTDMAQPWVKGYHRNIFVREFWKYVDIDEAQQRRAIGGA